MSKSNDINNYIIGFCAYYLMVYAVVFYPAIVMMEQFGSLSEEGGLITGGLASGSTVAVILFLCFCFRETGEPCYLLILIGIYLFFLWPFLQYVSWMWGDKFYTDDAVFPGFDWVPFLFSSK